MATLTGTLVDFRPAPMFNKAARILFIPSGPGVSALGTYLLATHPISVVPGVDGSFAVDLAATDDIRPDCWYRIQIEWLDLAGNFTLVDYPDWKLYVPVAGGSIGELLLNTIAGGFMDVHIGETNNLLYRFWYNPLTADLRSNP